MGWGLCPGHGVSVWEMGSLSKGISVGGMSLSGGVSVQGDPPNTIKSRRYASYWNAFLFLEILFRVATAQGKQGIWFLLFSDMENTGNLVLTQGKIC